MEPGKAWQRQPLDRKIMNKAGLSELVIRDHVGVSHQWSKTLLTGDPSSKVWVHPWGANRCPPLAGSKSLTHWNSESVNWSEAAGPPQV